VINCLFSGNKGSYGVFAVSWASSGAPDHIVNCTFVGNESTFTCNGAAIYAGDGTSISNTVAWDNHFSSPNGEPNPLQASQIRAVPGTTIHNSCIQGWDGTLGGTNNHGNDPRFVNAAGPDGTYGTEDDNPRLLPNSPLIDRGDVNALPLDTFDLDNDGDTTELLPVDMDWLPRIVGASVDVGAYEFQGMPCLADIDGTGVVNVSDLLAVIQSWGACQPSQTCNADLNLSGAVDVADLLFVITTWGTCP
jgi:hypothetical protein